MSILQTALESIIDIAQKALDATERADADASNQIVAAATGSYPDDPPPMTDAERESTMPEARPLPWGAQANELSEDFIDGVLWIEAELGLKAENLLACMKFESNLDPKARNPYSSASGLIQFMATTAKNLGTTIESIRTMDAMSQLGYVYRYFKDFKDRGLKLSEWDVADTYMAILWPAGIGKPLDHAIFIKGENTYRVNSGLDKNKDGFVTKREAAQRILDLYEEGLKESNVMYYFASIANRHA